MQDYTKFFITPTFLQYKKTPTVTNKASEIKAKQIILQPQ